MKRLLPYLGAALILTGIGMMGTPTLADAEPGGSLAACFNCLCKTVKIFGMPEESDEPVGDEFCKRPWRKFQDKEGDGRGIKDIDTTGGCATLLEQYTVAVWKGTASPVCSPRTGTGVWVEGKDFKADGMVQHSDWYCKKT